MCSIVGVVIYEAFLKKIETRWVLFWSVTVGIVGAFAGYVQAKRWNLEIGFNDIAYIYTTAVIFGTLGTALSTLPIMALFAKITPRRVEGTVFALLTGASNLDSSVLQPLTGAFINNHFVGVNKDDQSNYDKLCLINIITAPIGFLLLFLIPWKREIDEVTLKREIEEIDEIKASYLRREERYQKRLQNKQNKMAW